MTLPIAFDQTDKRTQAIQVLTAAVVLLSVTGATIIGISHDSQRATLLIGFLAPTIMSLVSALKSYQNGTDIKELKVSVDGKMEQLIESTRLAAQMTERDANKSIDTVTMPLSSLEVKL
jgi:hypothetical protein